MKALRPGSVLRPVALTVDRSVASVGLRFEEPGVLTVLFHSIFAGRDEVERDLVHPQEALTLDALRHCIEELLAAGYGFVSVEQLVGDLGPDGSHACLTFDDGYANNLRAVPVLEEYGVPAAIFVSTDHVLSGRRFWWDTVYVERRRRGAPPAVIEREIAALKGRSPGSIDADLVREFGEAATTPTSDLDRPLTPVQLRELAAHPLVTIGNHTVDHPLLTTVAPAERDRQIAGAQDALESLTGTRPLAVAYPNGDVDDSVIEAARAAGLAIGFTTTPRRERVPLGSSRRLRLGRYQLFSRSDVDAQLRSARSRFQLLNSARRVRGWIRSR